MIVHKMEYIVHIQDFFFRNRYFLNGSAFPGFIN